VSRVNAAEFASRLCSDFVRRIAERENRAFIVTQFKYPDGDFVSLYIEQNGDAVSVSDLGDTMFKCRMRGVEITDVRRKWIETICGMYGICFEDSIFRKPIASDRTGVDCLAFCEAISKISTLEYDAESRQKAMLPAQLESLIHLQVEPYRIPERNWTHSTFDPKASFPVDYRFNSPGNPTQIFHVASREKSTLVAAVSNFQRVQGIFAPTLSVISPEIELGVHQIDRLQRASTEIKFGVIGNEQRIVEFVLGRKAA